MTRRYSYTHILTKYPEHMSLDQMRTVCHISKRTARLLLHNGFVPYIDTGKKTHTYQIATADVIEYLKRRTKTPERYVLPKGSYAHGNTENRVFMPKEFPSRERIDEYPDVLKAHDAAIIAAVNPDTIKDWVKNKLVWAFVKSNAFHIPKVLLIEFLASSRHKRHAEWRYNYFGYREESDIADC